MPTDQAAGRNDTLTAIRFPLRLLTVACLLTITAFAGVGWIIFDVRRDATMFRDRLSRIERLRGVIVHLDEVLTMSARMAAATGNPWWEERYHQFEPQLDAAIKEAMQVSGNPSSITNAAKTDAANIKLVEMEHRAFALVRARRKEEAQALLISPEYETQKQIYAAETISSANQIRREFDANLQDDQRIEWLSIIAAMAVGGTSLVAWLSAARGVRRWRAQLVDSLHRSAEAESNLRAAHSELEVRVKERTADLAGSNESLQAEIVERKRAAGELRESEARTKAIVQSSLDCIVTIDQEGKILEFNPAAEVVFGHSRANVLGMELAEVIIPPSLRDQHRQGLMRYLATGEARVLGKRIEVLAIRSDGDEFPVELAITRLGADGPPTFTGFIRDISERKRAEHQLEIQYSVSLVLAESSTAEEATPRVLQVLCKSFGWELSELWSVDPREDVLRCVDIWSAPNIPMVEFKAASRQMSFARNVGLPGRVWASGQPTWIPDVVQDGNFPRALAAKQAGLHAAFAFPILMGNGVGGVIEIFSRQILPYDEDMLRTFAVLGSQLGQFFQRRRLEDQLLQSQRLETVGKLAGGIAHEFNSILTAIIGESELLLSDLPPGSPLAANAISIGKAADRAATLTRQLLAYGRKQLLQPEILDLNAVLAGMENTLRHLMGRGADVRISPGAGLRAVKADAGQIEQVIMNMAINAADAMPQGGKLTLETANVTVEQEQVGGIPELKPGDYVMLAITDTGTGMSEDVKARVFEPFFTTKGVGQGTGLGLSTCYGIVKQSGGHISVYSELGRGTSFKMYLPVEQQAKSPVQRLDSPDLPRGTETILLVEDDPALREMASMLLKRLGYTVLAAGNGVEALSLKQQCDIGRIDLLFTDVVMPHMSGIELAERVRGLSPHTRVLFTSAYTENAIVHQGVLNKGVALLQKPFTPSALAHKLREVLDQPIVPEPDAVLQA